MCDPVEKVVSELAMVRLAELLSRTQNMDDLASSEASFRLLPFATKRETANRHIEILCTKANELLVSRSIDASVIIEQALQMLMAAEVSAF